MLNGGQLLPVCKPLIRVGDLERRPAHASRQTSGNTTALHGREENRSRRFPVLGKQLNREGATR